MASELRKPLLAANGQRDEDPEHDNYLDDSLRKVGTTAFGDAGIFSKLTFSWLNPFLKLGHQKPLEKDDVPLLMRKHRAKELYAKFSENWPEQPEKNALGTTLVKILGGQFFLTTTVPAFGKLCVQFIGPVLIGSFITVTAGEEAFPFEGYVLVLILFLARVVEVGANHFYMFNCVRLGIHTRTTLVAAVYRKGLRISNIARQEHGVGQIVNYMSTDVQQMSDSVMYLNNMWLVPAQVLVAVIILFYVARASAAAGALLMACSSVVTILIGKRLQQNQRNIMAGKDARMKATVEALANMKIIKLQAWDATFFDLVAKARKLEFEALRRYLLWQACTVTSLWVTPTISTVAIFAAEYFRGRSMSSVAAFTTIATIKIVQEPLRLLPPTMVFLSQAYTSLFRLEKYLRSEELNERAVESFPAGTMDLAVSVKGAIFTWGVALKDPPSLDDINFEVASGSLVAIVGKVGTGKSSLLSSLLGEMNKVSGKVKLCGSKAYVSQQAWIQSGTVQDNILFGKPMDRARYESVLECCALRDDLAQFDGGDQTEIGERGLNLSGGQKQRIQLARAVYQNCDIYLLDDIFSAVDAHTALSLFRDCIMGVLAQKTVLLVTHQIDLLRGADLILVMRDGRIVQKGQYDDLMTEGAEFKSLVEASNRAINKVLEQESDEAEEQIVDFLLPEEQLSKSPTLASESLRIFHVEQYERKLSSKSLPRPSSMTKKTTGTEDTSGSSGQLVRDEERATGKVSLKVYWEYLTRIYKGVFVLFILIIQVGWVGFQISGDLWVASATPPEGNQDSSKMSRFVQTYATMIFSSALCFLIRTVTYILVCLQTTQSFYFGMLKSLFRAPMAFFDTTPTGRILSRSSLDQTQVDVFVPFWVNALLANLFQLTGVMVVTFGIVWELVFLLIPLGFVYIQYQNYYFATSREMTRVDAITKAPVIHHFSETVAGVAVIRGFREQKRFIQTNMDRIDSNVRMEFHNVAATEWVGFRMEMLGVWILCGSALLYVILPDAWIDKQLAGLSLTYGLQLNASIFLVSLMYCQVENRMVSVERIDQYSHLPSEAELTIEETRPVPMWPELGGICFQDLHLRYRPNTPLVLKGITMKVQGGQKVGVVGRTGSGKSTLISALFRLVEEDQGYILIDNVNTSTLGLNDLRSRLGIIPQDPTMFSGKIRHNLDPLGEHTDTEIWEVLQKCQLGAVVKQLPGQLDAPVLDSGENFSLGQRQLFCLGRVLLKRSQILVLDEATASVDAETDSIMQSTIREEFKNSTVISVAHRIPTVMDYDKVLVLDSGKVREYDSPTALVNNPASLFSALVREYTARSTTYIQNRKKSQDGNDDDFPEIDDRSQSFPVVDSEPEERYTYDSA